MSIFKKILLYAGLVVSIIVLIACTAGIIGAWVYNRPITEAILDIVMPITDVVDVAEGVTGETGAVLDEVSTGLVDAQAQVAAIGGEVADTKIVVEAVCLHPLPQHAEKRRIKGIDAFVAKVAVVWFVTVHP